MEKSVVESGRVQTPMSPQGRSRVLHCKAGLTEGPRRH
ncbi:unnamed protein product [Fusarium graminearum]|uniref:Chromosome 2, complete genome n=1 Tax=Gibberella zeae (strain ATCC MYA-4620 / CBS 123657 / FGSC 9075 / NRRL 31084 / PH-1) TaxID=229533 RepID=A0A0E0S6Q2_GIBZE|nr:hypothetical protein FG05_35083 [Fusarium graminearum]CEF79177.1 unnamed protein product [Fusarium graminearum]